MVIANGNRLPLTLTRREALQLIGLGLLAPGVLAGCSDSGSPVFRQTEYTATIAAARAAVTQALAATDTPAISVALIDRDRVIWAEAFGLIDKGA